MPKQSSLPSSDVDLNASRQDMALISRREFGQIFEALGISRGFRFSSAISMKSREMLIMLSPLVGYAKYFLGPV